jgi:hypothetical protein
MKLFIINQINSFVETDGLCSCFFSMENDFQILELQSQPDTDENGNLSDQSRENTEHRVK